LGQFIDGLNNDTTAVMTNVHVSTDDYLDWPRPSGKPKVAQWAVKKVASQYVGFINVVTPKIKQYSTGANDILINSEANACGSSEAMVRTALFEMKSQHPACKIIIAIADDMDDTAILSAQIEDIDVVLTSMVEGDTVVTNIFGQSVAQVQSTALDNRYGQALGRVSLAFDKQGNLMHSQARFEPLDSQTPLDPRMWAFTEEKTRLVQLNLATAVGHTQMKVYGERGCHMDCAMVDLGGCRFGDCGMGRLATDAFDDACERHLGRNCDLAVINAGAIRGSFDAGNITSGDVMRVFPFEPSPTSIVSVSGGTLMQALSHMTTRGHSGGSSRENTGGFLQWKGMRYSWNPDLAGTESRIVTAEVYDKVSRLEV
jgi:2',3'-cyclic-nucleotide 2'-phosphodiesterase (5'-nucleotidase family)